MIRFKRSGGGDVWVSPECDFNWWCFFFGSLWGLFTGTWPVFWLSILANAVGLCVGMTGETGIIIVFWCLGFMLNLFMSSKANEWRASALLARGYSRE